MQPLCVIEFRDTCGMVKQNASKNHQNDKKGIEWQQQISKNYKKLFQRAPNQTRGKQKGSRNHQNDKKGVEWQQKVPKSA